MAKRISIGAALALSAILTYGLVNTATHITVPLSELRTQGIFAGILADTWDAWSDVRGVPPFTHADEFGRFYAAFVFLLCPLIGFAIFWLGSKHRIGGQLWKPLAIATIFATPLERLMRSGFSTIGLDMLWGEVIRTAL